MQANYRQFAVAVLRVVMGGVFVYAGWLKIRAAADFADDIAGFRLLPGMLINLLAIGLPPFEVLLGILLVINWQRRIAAFCALVTSTVFLLALASAAARGIAVDCGCFGNSLSTLAPGERIWFSIGRDLLLVAAAGIVYADCSER